MTPRDEHAAAETRRVAQQTAREQRLPFSVVCLVWPVTGREVEYSRHATCRAASRQLDRCYRDNPGLTYVIRNASAQQPTDF